MKVTAVATRSGRWWAVDVRDVDGAFTQVRRLDQVADAVRDVVSMLDEVPASTIDVQVCVVIPDEVAGSLDAVAVDRRRAAKLAQEASTRLAAVARRLTDDGLTTRDVGHVLGVSHQRVAQILKADETVRSDPPVPSRRYVARSDFGGRPSRSRNPDSAPGGRRPFD